MTRSLLGMADNLRRLRVTRVVMEATSDYWKRAFHVLEAAGFDTWLVNARDVNTCPDGARPTSWTRCGRARSPNAR
ncbi:IS110 family transposase [Streptomyces gilvus]|uniref:IS110 family transposase n=1 Tax=Streptomyces gilvus TaxID=2920937 RepID=UPI001F116CD1|nr:IS110 family transposase [Streptomyces sp. CME 23]MCH5671474.1 IS110 family transposase [Streptomyces sp. CME 23]